MKHTFLGFLMLVLINVLPARAGVSDGQYFAPDIEAGEWLALALPVQQDTSESLPPEELECLTRTIYGEARNQTYEGMLAVAATIVNRTRDPRWAGSICSVVKQKGQFAGYWNAPRPDNPLEWQAWDFAVMASEQVTERYYEIPLAYQSYLFFHEKNIASFTWAEKKQRIDDHVFYG